MRELDKEITVVSIFEKLLCVVNFFYAKINWFAVRREKGLAINFLRVAKIGEEARLSLQQIQKKSIGRRFLRLISKQSHKAGRKTQGK